MVKGLPVKLVAQSGQTLKQGITEMHVFGDQPIDTSKWGAHVAT